MARDMIVLLIFVLAFSIGIDGAKFVPATALAHIGRFAVQNDHTAFAWPGVHIETIISGSSTLSIEFSDSGSNYFDVQVDGKTVDTIQTKNQKSNFTVPAQLPNSFTLTIIKRTESFAGVTAFYGIYVSDDAKLSAAPRPSRRIEFIGDSITCGYGNMGKFPCSFTTATENAGLSHGYVTAQMLEADVMITAWSGIGVIRNSGDKNASAHPLPSFYTDTVAMNSGFGKWDFLKWIPQAIVINLGTNDFWNSGLAHSAYQSAYVTFIGEVRKAYGNAELKIFLECGPMSQAYCGDIATIAKSTNAFVIPTIGALPQDQLGCDWHPSYIGDQTMAKTEGPAIKAEMGW